MNLVFHEHPPEELDAPAWDADRLRTHLASMHDVTLPAGDELHGVPAVQAMAAMHAAEHPVQAGIGSSPATRRTGR